MSKIQIIIISILIISIFSCSDKFINDIEIDVPEEEQLLVINLELTEAATFANTFVARTANLEEADHTFFDEAVVDLFKEGQFLKNLKYDPLQNFYSANFNPDDL